MANDILQVSCDVCADIAHEPYIECCECETNLCQSCFASGREVGSHKNDHKYSIRRNDFPLFDNCNWSAKEECKLLSAISTYGFGNWEEISKSVHTRSKLECQEHYKKYFIENVQCEELKLIPETEQSIFPKILNPYLYNTDLSTNPPRNNQSDHLLAGYNAYRSEFELSYDNNAESIFSIEDSYSDDDDDDDECIDALKVSLLSALNTRLKERQRRYKIIQNHGLIMTNKLFAWLIRFDSTISRTNSERLLSFMQFMTSIQFDAFMESISLEEETMQRLFKLCEYRKQGIRTLHSARLYKQLKPSNDIMNKEQRYATLVMLKDFDSYTSRSKIMFGKGKRMKRSAIPLDITDLPGYFQLSANEKTLCSNVRLLPKNYMEMKKLLITENNKLGSLKLLDARRILKIDVNKTRKIYDFLITEGFISKPFQQ